MRILFFNTKIGLRIAVAKTHTNTHTKEKRAENIFLTPSFTLIVMKGFRFMVVGADWD